MVHRSFEREHSERAELERNNLDATRLFLSFLPLSLGE